MSPDAKPARTIEIHGKSVALVDDDAKRWCLEVMTLLFWFFGTPPSVFDPVARTMPGLCAGETWNRLTLSYFIGGIQRREREDAEQWARSWSRPAPPSDAPHTPGSGWPASQCMDNGIDCCSCDACVAKAGGR